MKCRKFDVKVAMMLVKEMMTVHPSCRAPDSRLDVVAKMMMNHNIGAIPVCDGDRLAGMITDRDIVVRAVGEGMAPTQTSGTAAAGIITAADIQRRITTFAA